MSDSPTPPIVNPDALLGEGTHVSGIDRKGPYCAQLVKIGEALGGTRIGMNLTVVPPKSRAFPRHYHFVNDEAFIVLAGEGTLHYGEDSHALRAGDIFYARAGTGIPFGIENTSEAELRYIGLSTMIPADVFYYPDSDKHGIMANGVPFQQMPSAGLERFAKWVEADHGVAYYHNDPEAAQAD